MASLAILLCGFSIFSALTLAAGHFRADLYPGQPVQRWMGLVVLAALAGLQLAHVAWLLHDLPWVDSLPYRMALFTVAPAFHLLSQPMLRPQLPMLNRETLAGHALPLLLVPALPRDVALPLAFVIGSVYLLWLARSLYQLRHERDHFRREMMLLGMVFMIAVAVATLGFMHTLLPGKLFFELYAIAIGAAFLLVLTALGMRPRLPVEVSESAQQACAAYSNSTLRHVNCDALLTRLDALMRQDRLYKDAALSLASLAARLEISPHQLSELLNARLGKSFSRTLREWRVDAARTMLLAERSASVLSVGLDVGFTSQSSFYEAFREIEGTTPGQFRKLHTAGNMGAEATTRDG